MSEPSRPSDPVPPSPASPAPQPPPHGIIETPEELRQRQIHDKEQHQDAHSAAVGAAVGLGCLSLALLPWLLGFLAFLAILAVWAFHTHRHFHGS